MPYCGYDQKQREVWCGVYESSDSGEAVDIRGSGFPAGVPFTKEVSTPSTFLVIFNQGQLATFLDGILKVYTSDLDTFGKQVAIQLSEAAQIDNIKFWDLSNFGLYQDLEIPTGFQPVIDHMIAAGPTFEEDFETPQYYWNRMEVVFDEKPIGNWSSVVADGGLVLEKSDQDTDSEFWLQLFNLAAKDFAIQYDFSFSVPESSANQQFTSISTTWDTTNDPKNFDANCKISQTFQKIECALGYSSHSGDSWALFNNSFSYVKENEASSTMLVVFYDGQAFMFLDGNLVGEASVLEYTDQTFAIRIGQEDPEGSFTAQIDNIKFWDLSNFGLYEDLEIPTGFQPVIDHIKAAAPTFADDFSTEKPEWGTTTEGTQISTLVLPDATLEVPSSSMSNELWLPTNGLLDADDFVLQYDFYPSKEDIEMFDSFGFAFHLDQNALSYHQFEIIYTNLTGDIPRWTYSTNQRGDVDIVENGLNSLKQDANRIILAVRDNNLAVWVNGDLLFTQSDIGFPGIKNAFIKTRQGGNIRIDNVKFWNLDGVELDQSGGDTAPVSFGTPIDTRTNLADGAAMVYIPAGEFLMGSEVGDDDETPVHQVYLDAFWLYQTEVTNAQYAQCVTAGECALPKFTNHYNNSSSANHRWCPLVGFRQMPTVTGRVVDCRPKHSGRKPPEVG